MSFWRHQSYLFFQETGEFVGTVGHVYNSGASDLLHVKLDSSLNVLDKTGKPRTAEMVASDHFVWVPFVEAIVPNVDMDRKEIQITPPKGLLELNLRFDERSKKERRQLVRHTHLYYTTYGLKLMFDINFLQRLYTCMLYVIICYFIGLFFLKDWESDTRLGLFYLYFDAPKHLCIFHLFCLFFLQEGDPCLN